MKKNLKFFLLGCVIILLSTPLARISLNIIYVNQKLSYEYNTILKGFINSYMLFGFLLFSIGVIKYLKNKE